MLSIVLFMAKRIIAPILIFWKEIVDLWRVFRCSKNSHGAMKRNQIGNRPVPMRTGSQLAIEDPLRITDHSRGHYAPGLRSRSATFFVFASKGCVEEMRCCGSIRFIERNAAEFTCRLHRPIFHRFVLGPLHFTPNLVLRNRPLKEDGPIVHQEPTPQPRIGQIGQKYPRPVSAHTATSRRLTAT